MNKLTYEQAFWN